MFLSAFRNESQILGVFLDEFAEAIRDAGLAHQAVLYLVDDYSTDDSRQVVERWQGVGVDVRIIAPPTNLGNQGAMFYGLSRVEVGTDDVLVTFDCDGEDDVKQMKSIIELGVKHPDNVVLVERGRRREGWRFRVFFKMYKLMFRFLTHKQVIPNNFMLIPGRYVPAIRKAPLAAAHFAYGVLRLNPPYVLTSRDRRTRYGGQTSQNMFMLVSHGLVGLMVFYEVVVAKLFMLIFALGGLETGLVAAALFLPHQWPGTAPFLVGIAASVAIGALTLLLLLVSATAAVFFKLTVYHLIVAEAAGRSRAGD